jgi:hypothetical protein
LLFICAPAAVAADIQLLDIPGQPIQLISIKGEITDGDGVKFYKLVDGIERASVILESPGGLVREALQIGAEIRMRNFATMVLPDTECYSACGLIWVSGARRYMSQSSQIGFHAAYREENGEYRESGVANAEMGSFLTHLGLRIEAIRFFTTAGPANFLLLTPEHARALGIEVFEQSGFDVTTPLDAPTVDTYADRFVSFAFLKSRCAVLFDADVEAIDRAAKTAFNEGNRMVGPDEWVDLWMPMLDRVKAEIESKGALMLCLETEAHLRSQGQPTGVDGPSYACAEAATPTELAMCKDEDVWAKDRAMSSIYFWIRDNVEPATKKQILLVQRNWLKERNACGNDTACLHSVYDSRLEDLKGIELQ